MAVQFFPSYTIVVAWGLLALAVVAALIPAARAVVLRITATVVGGMVANLIDVFSFASLVASHLEQSTVALIAPFLFPVSLLGGMIGGLLVARRALARLGDRLGSQ